MPQLERQGPITVPATIMYPKIRGGVCEYCGTLDSRIEPQFQYKLCPHFRNLGTIRCSYCPDHKDADEVNRLSIIIIHGSPTNPNELVAVCDSYDCTRKHFERFKVNK